MGVELPQQGFPAGHPIPSPLYALGDIQKYQGKSIRANGN